MGDRKVSKDGAESPKGEGRALQGVGRRRQRHPAPGQEEAEDRLQRPLPRTRVLKEMDRPERKTHREPSEGRRERGWPGGGLGTRYCLGTECGAGVTTVGPVHRAGPERVAPLAGL